MRRTYSELRRLDTIEDRFQYLRLEGNVGRETFGFDRYLNQQFYTSSQWRRIRNHVIARDIGRDLGIEGFEIHDRIYIHHMNPMTVEDITSGNPDILDPEFLISVTLDTHNAIHYGNKTILKPQYVERAPGDTTLW